jgi:predicted transcriptional regulator
MSDDASTDVTSLTVQLLSAYLSNNTVPSGELAGLIATTRSALAASAVVDTAVEEETYEPAVSVRKSLGSRDFIISMIDGKPYKMLKRHLSLHGLTPAEYRARYNLPSDYPMVAAAYSERRREVAKHLVWGARGAWLLSMPRQSLLKRWLLSPARKKAVKPVADTPAAVAETAPVVRRGRKAKVVEETSVTDAVKPVAKRAKKAKPEQVSEEVTA